MREVELSSSASGPKLYDTQPVASQEPHAVEPRLILRRGEFRHHSNFDFRWKVPGCTPSSVVMVSICEIGAAGGHVLPFQSDVALEVHSVVPGDNEVRVRGFIGGAKDLNIRIHFLID